MCLIRPAPNKAGQPRFALVAEEATRVRDALARTRELSTYRLELREITHDGTAEGAAGAEGHGTLNVEYTAAFDAADAMFSLRGLSAILFGFTPAHGPEAITVDGRAYARGPLPLPGATEEVWYDVGADPKPPLRPWYRDIVAQLPVAPSRRDQPRLDIYQKLKYPYYQVT